MTRYRLTIEKNSRGEYVWVLNGVRSDWRVDAVPVGRFVAYLRMIAGAPTTEAVL